MTHPHHDAHEVHAMRRIIEHGRALDALCDQGHITPNVVLSRLAALIAAPESNRAALMVEQLTLEDRPSYTRGEEELLNTPGKEHIGREWYAQRMAKATKG